MPINYTGKIVDNKALEATSTMSTDNPAVPNASAAPVNNQGTPAVPTKKVAGTFGGGTTGLPLTTVYSDGTTSAAQGSTQTTPLTAPRTPANVPSSSASAVLGANAVNAAIGATTPEKVNNQPSENEQLYMDTYGVSLDAVRKKFGTDEIALAEIIKPIKDQKALDDKAKEEAEMQKQALAAKTAQAYAQEDENFRELNNQLNTQRQGALTQMKALSYAANPFAKTTSTTGANETVINTKFNTLQENINSQYELARQAISNGDTEGYSTIMANMQKTLAANAASTNQLLDSISKSQQQNRQFTQTMTDKYVDDYQTALSKNQYTSAQISGMTDEQVLNSPAGQIAKLQNQTSGQPIDVNAIRSDLMSAQIANEKLANQTAKTNADIAYAQVRLSLAQANLVEKQAAMVDAQSLSSVGNGEYMTAFRNIQLSSNMTTAKTASALSDLASFANTGNESALKGGINDIITGFQNGITAFEDAPFSNIIAWKALGGISEVIKNPADAAKKITEKAEGVKETVTDMVTNPKGWITEHMPETVKMNTITGLTKVTDAYSEKLTQQVKLINDVVTNEGKLTSADLTTQARAALETQISNAQDALRTNFQQQNAYGQMTLASVEDGLRIASPSNPDAMMESIRKIANDSGDLASKGYQQYLPKNAPDYTIVLDALKKFTDGIDTLNDPAAYKAFTQYYKDLSNRVSLNEAWENAGKNAKTFMQQSARNGLDLELANRFSQNPNAPEFRLPSTADLKANSKGVLNSIKEGSEVTNTKNQYNEIVRPAIESTIDKEVYKAHGDEGLKQYKKADQQWGDAQNVARQILKRVETATDKTAESIIRNNIDLLDRLDPTGKLSDQVKSYFASKILEDARTETGYNPEKIISGINKYRDILRQSDKELLTEQAEVIGRAKSGIDEINAKQDVIGKNSIEMAQKVGKIETLSDLERFSKLSGKTPEQLGDLYRQNAVETAMNKVSEVTGEADPAEMIREFLKEDDKLGGKTAESKAVYDKMTPPEMKAGIKMLEENLEYYDKLLKKKATPLYIRGAKVALGAAAFFLGHGFFGSSMIRGAFKDTIGNIAEPLAIDITPEGFLKRETPPAKAKTPGVISKIKNSKVILASGIQANANENQPKGDYVSQEEVEAIGLPQWMAGNYTDAHLKADLESAMPPVWFSEIAKTRWPNLDEQEAWDKIKSLQ